MTYVLLLYNRCAHFAVQEFEKEQIFHEAEREKRQLINILCMGALNPEEEGRPILKVLIDQLIEFTGEGLNFVQILSLTYSHEDCVLVSNLQSLRLFKKRKRKKGTSPCPVWKATWTIFQNSSGGEPGMQLFFFDGRQQAMHVCIQRRRCTRTYLFSTLSLSLTLVSTLPLLSK